MKQVRVSLKIINRPEKAEGKALLRADEQPVAAREICQKQNKLDGGKRIHSKTP